MEKQVLILNGSPRKGGNTDLLAEALAEGVRSAGNRCDTIHLRELELRPCTGCLACGGGRSCPCVQKDEMHKVYDAVLGADVVVFATPVYWWHYTAQMKAALDRLFAIAAKIIQQAPGKGSALLAVAGDTDPEVFTELVQHYRTRIAATLSLNNRGEVLAHGYNHTGEIAGSPRLDEARAFGATL